MSKCCENVASDLHQSTHKLPGKWFLSIEEPLRHYCENSQSRCTVELRLTEYVWWAIMNAVAVIIVRSLQRETSQQHRQAVHLDRHWRWLLFGKQKILPRQIAEKTHLCSNAIFLRYIYVRRSFCRPYSLLQISGNNNSVLREWIACISCSFPCLRRTMCICTELRKHRNVK